MVAPKLVRRRALAVAFAGLAATAALAGCGSDSGSSNGAETGFVTVQTGITQISAGHRQAMPALSGTTLQGKSLNVSYSGHVTVLNVWGSWCTP